jgi:anti-sigma regulatory factor (Ser/Thr protein kinase)
MRPENHTFPLDMASLGKIRTWVKGYFCSSEWDLSTHKLITDKVLIMFVMALDELCSNAILHNGMVPENRKLTITLERLSDAMQAKISYKGTDFNLNNYIPPTLDTLVESGIRGKLGVNFIQRSMDTVDYCHSGGTSYYLLKKLIS